MRKDFGRLVINTYDTFAGPHNGTPIVCVEIQEYETRDSQKEIGRNHIYVLSDNKGTAYKFLEHIDSDFVRQLYDMPENTLVELGVAVTRILKPFNLKDLDDDNVEVG